MLPTDSGNSQCFSIKRPFTQSSRESAIRVRNKLMFVGRWRQFWILRATLHLFILSWEAGYLFSVSFSSVVSKFYFNVRGRHAHPNLALSEIKRQLLINFRETEPCSVSEHVNTRALYPAAFSLRQGCETSSTRLVYFMSQGLINQ